MSNNNKCDIIFYYKDTTSTDEWGETLKLKRHYLNDSIFIDSLFRLDLPISVILSDTFKLTKNELLYLYKGKFEVLFSEELFFQNKQTFYRYIKDEMPIAVGELSYEPEQFYWRFFQPEKVVYHPKWGKCYSLWMETDPAIGSTYPVEVLFNIQYGLIGIGSSLVNKIKISNCK